MRRHLLQGLVLPPVTEPAPEPDEVALGELGRRLEGAARRRLSIREVDGSCNGREVEIRALSNAFYELEQFSLRFVASPGHANVLRVTGPVTKEHVRGIGANLYGDTRPEGGSRRW